MPCHAARANAHISTAFPISALTLPLTHCAQPGQTFVQLDAPSILEGARQ